MTVHVELAEYEAAMLIAYLRAQQGYGGTTLIDVRSKVERALEWSYQDKDVRYDADDPHMAIPVER